MPSMVWVRTVLKKACAVGQTKPVALPCSSARIEVLLSGVGAGERKVDVVEHARLGCARLAGRRRPQPLRERRHGGGVVVVEKGAVALGRAHGLGGGRRRHMRRVILRARLGREAGARGDDRGADQEGATRVVRLVVWLAHVSSLGMFRVGSWSPAVRCACPGEVDTGSPTRTCAKGPAWASCGTCASSPRAGPPIRGASAARS